MDIKLPKEIRKEFIYALMGFGSKEPDLRSIELVKNCSDIILGSAQPRATYKILPMGFSEANGEVYILNEKYILKGKSIAMHLKGCSQCILLAVTLGHQVDKIIRRAQITDMAKAVALDACSSSLIEDLCEQINKQILEELEGQGMVLATRFSPGYGDLPLSTQNIFSNLLEMEKRIGLTQSSEHLLLPRKSITAIIGIKTHFGLKEEKFEGYYLQQDKESACQICQRKNQCEFRNNGGHCKI